MIFPSILFDCVERPCFLAVNIRYMCFLHIAIFLYMQWSDTSLLRLCSHESYVLLKSDVAYEESYPTNPKRCLYLVLFGRIVIFAYFGLRINRIDRRLILFGYKVKSKLNSAFRNHLLKPLHNFTSSLSFPLTF